MEFQLDTKGVFSISVHMPVPGFYDLLYLFSVVMTN
jgi:hypothetical protein